GVRAARAPDAERRHGPDARAADRRGVGHELVRVDEDPRRPRIGPPQEAPRRCRHAPLRAHAARRRLPLQRARRGGMSLRGAVVAAVAYVLLLVIVALAIPLALTTSRRIESEVRASARTGAQVVAASASGRLDRPAELSVIANRAASDLGGRVLILDAAGRPLADSAGPDRADDTYVGRPEVAAALSGKSVQGTRHSDTLDEDLLYTAVPVLDKGQTVGAVRLTQSVDGVNSTIQRDRLALAGVGLGALILGLVVAW